MRVGIGGLHLDPNSGSLRWAGVEVWQLSRCEDQLLTEATGNRQAYDASTAWREGLKFALNGGNAPYARETPGASVLLPYLERGLQAAQVERCGSPIVTATTSQLAEIAQRLSGIPEVARSRLSAILCS